MMYGGIKVIESDLLLRDRVHLRERKWCHRKMWRSEKRFNATYEQVPYMVHDKANNVIYAHPDIVKRLETLPTDETRYPTTEPSPLPSLLPKYTGHKGYAHLSETWAEIQRKV